jgi:hypothetical protein
VQNPGHVVSRHLAIFFCNAKFGRYRGTADVDQAAPIQHPIMQAKARNPSSSGVVRGAGFENAGRLGALAAAEVIQHIGARPQVSLRELAKQAGLPV